VSSCKVLEEACSIAERIAIFNQKDDNPYHLIAKNISDKKIKHIVTVARGTSDCVALYASYLFAKTLGLTTYSLPPSIITLENSHFDFSNTLVLVISQSGLSKDLIICEQASRKMGAETMILTNNVNSPIVNNANYFFHINAGEEESVAATKTFALSLLNIIKLIAVVSDNKKIIDNIFQLPDHISKESKDSWDPELIDKNVSNGFIISRGLGYALSTEISIKFKELCQEQIEPFSSAEVMHGPKSLIENSFKLFTLSLNDSSGSSVLKDTKKLMKITNKVYSITYQSNASLNYSSMNHPELDSIIIMSKFYPWIIKYSMYKGLNPDNPRYLTKVTQTY
jgi:glucosamine--fructose-6-phosphate aminotransferase (isomerizing)